MRRLRLSHLKRWSEVTACFTTSSRPWSVLGRYLKIGQNGYPFDLLLKNKVRVTIEDYHDLVTAWVVWFRGEYRVPPGAETVLDVGGNIGLFSLYAALRNPGARIVAVEPFPVTFARLESNIARNGLANRVDCWNVGVADSPGVRAMPVEGPSQSRGLLPADSATVNGCSWVNVKTFGDLVRDACEHLRSDRLDLVKIDIEGAEHEAVLSAPPESFLPIQELGMEYHPSHPKRPLFDHLRSGGLRLVHDSVFGPDCGVAHFRRETAP
jgi:FkbM family methyltransferase